MQGSDIQEFLRGARVLLTGGTGFMGKMVLEKLLRSIPHLDHVYLIIRPKKGNGVNDRLNAIFEDRVSDVSDVATVWSLVSSWKFH